jgi:hypothetical protein
LELSLSGFLLFLGVPLLLGGALLRAAGIGPRTDPLAYPGWMWLAGALAVAALEALRLLAGLPAPTSVVAGAAGLSLVLLLASRRVPRVVDEGLESARAGWSGWEHGLLGAVLVLVLAGALHQALAASLTVVQSNDEANFWALRAKLLYQARGFGGEYAHAVRAGELPNASYPLFNSLLQLWVFDCAGQVTHVANRFPLQLSSLALLLCTAAACRRASRPWIAAALLVPLATTTSAGIALRQANADVLVALGGLVAADALQRGRAARARAWPWLGTLAATLALWSKKEGTLLVLASLLALAACARWRGRAGELRRALALARTRCALFLVLPGAALAGTLLHNHWLQPSGSHAIRPAALAAAWEEVGDLPQVVATLLRFGWWRLNAIPVVFALLALLAWPRRAGALAFVPLANLLFVAVLMVAILPEAEYLLRTAGVRLLSQLLPLQVLWLAAIAPGLLARLRSS